MTTQNPLLLPVVEALNGRARLRVWSLIVTILGDVAQPHGGQISLTDILAITGQLGVESGAVRTALSRLSKDGWVESEKSGRNSSYQFGTVGRADYGPAAAQIYAAPISETDENWIVAIPQAQTAAQRSAFVKSVGRLAGIIGDGGVAIWPLERAPHAKDLASLDCLVIKGLPAQTPDWLSGQVADTTVAQEFRDISKAFAPLIGAELSPLEALAARVALIHLWRRLILRHPMLPSRLQPKGWPADDTLVTVKTLYRQLIAPSELFWQGTFGNAQGLDQRFK